jgi:hypothetical protein
MLRQILQALRKINLNICTRPIGYVSVKYSSSTDIKEIVVVHA